MKKKRNPIFLVQDGKILELTPIKTRKREKSVEENSKKEISSNNFGKFEIPKNCRIKFWENVAKTYSKW